MPSLPKESLQLLCINLLRAKGSALCSEVVPSNRTREITVNSAYSLSTLSVVHRAPGTSLERQVHPRPSESQSTPYKAPRCSAYHKRPTNLGLIVTFGVFQGHKCTRDPNASLIKLIILPSWEQPLLYLTSPSVVSQPTPFMSVSHRSLPGTPDKTHCLSSLLPSHVMSSIRQFFYHRMCS